MSTDLETRLRASLDAHLAEPMASSEVLLAGARERERASTRRRRLRWTVAGAAAAAVVAFAVPYVGRGARPDVNQPASSLPAPTVSGPVRPATVADLTGAEYVVWPDLGDGPRPFGGKDLFVGSATSWTVSKVDWTIFPCRESVSAHVLADGRLEQVPTAVRGGCAQVGEREARIVQLLRETHRAVLEGTGHVVLSDRTGQRLAVLADAPPERTPIPVADGVAAPPGSSSWRLATARWWSSPPESTAGPAALSVITGEDGSLTLSVTSTCTRTVVTRLDDQGWIATRESSGVSEPCVEAAETSEATAINSALQALYGIRFTPDGLLLLDRRERGLVLLVRAD